MTNHRKLIFLAIAASAGILMLVGLIGRSRTNNPQQTTALFDALHRGDAKQAKQALVSGADANARHYTPRSPHVALLDRLTSLPLFGPNGSQFGGRFGEPTVLMLAAEKGEAEIVRALLDHGADADTKAHYGRTALMEAAGSYHADKTRQLRIVRSLLDHGADVNGRATNGQTALMLASQRYQGEPVIKLLLARGADVNAKDIRGMTPLIYVSQVGEAGIMKLLLEAGADAKAVDSDGKTAFMRASQIGHTNLIPLLRQAGAAK